MNMEHSKVKIDCDPEGTLTKNVVLPENLWQHVILHVYCILALHAFY